MAVVPVNEIARPAPSIRPLRILVVDDDPLQLRALQRAMREHRNVDLTAIEHSIDALLAIGSVKPDLVVLDLYMPGVDGLEVCRRLKANAETCDIDVVIASAAMNAELETAARDAGALAMLPKPVRVETLLALRPAPSPITDIVAAAAVPDQHARFSRGANVLVGMLEDAGVDVVFGLPGGAISPVHDALLDSHIRVVTTRHEAGAMFAAAAYARATGKLGVVAVTSGPGALNSMTGLATAFCDDVPLLLLVGEVPRAAHGKGVLQDGSALGLQIVEMARHVSKLALEIPRPSALPHLVRRAVATAQSGRKGPVVLTLPLDVTTAEVVMPRVAGTVTVGAIVETESLDEIAALASAATRPLILAGNGVRGDGAPERLRAVAERLGCPVATTPKGKGVFPESHPLSVGVLGLGGHPSARSYLEQGCDVVIAIGTSLGDLSTDGFSPLLQAATLVHIDIDARQVGKSYAPTHAVVASAREFLGGLAERLDQLSCVIHRFDTGVQRLPPESSPKRDRLASSDAVLGVQALLPDDTIYTVDSGEHFLFATHYLHIDLADSFLVMTGLGSMGQSIGGAIGAQLAHPGRAVAAICGDGCFAMNAFEIATAVAEQLPIRVFVFNDQRLGMVEHGHRSVYGRAARYPTNPLDVCLVARGLGADAIRVETVEQLAMVKDLVATAPGPVVVDVAIDGDLHLPKRDRVAAMNDRAATAFGQPKLVN